MLQEGIGPGLLEIERSGGIWKRPTSRSGLRRRPSDFTVSTDIICGVYNKFTDYQFK